jgi:hypothetical protein
MLELEYNPNISLFAVFYDYNINKQYTRKIINSIISNEFYMIGEKFVAFTNYSDLIFFKLNVNEEEMKKQAWS